MSDKELREETNETTEEKEVVTETKAEKKDEAEVVTKPAHDRAQEDEHQRNHRIDARGLLGILLAKEPDHVDLAEQIPAQNRGKRKEEQTDCHENRTD